MLSDWIFGLFSGFALAMAIFMVAAGLTWVFGILKIINMAHGHFFMVGAYLALSVAGLHPRSLLAYLGASLAAGAVVGALGYITNQFVFRRLLRVDYHYTLIGTFALLIFVEGVIKLIWGGEIITVSPPPELSGAISVAGILIPRLTIFVLLAGLALFVVLDTLMQRTWFGKLLQAVAHDPWMSGILGVNVPVFLTGSVVVSFMLAGLAGGLLVPFNSLHTGLGGSYLLFAFFAVIIGGSGSIRGAFVASILLATINELNFLLVPSYPGLAVYFALAAFLIWWPNGIFAPPGGTK